MPFLNKLYPEKLRTRILLLTILLVCSSIMVIAYLVEKEGKNLLLQEKGSKLYAITQMLDVMLGDEFETIDSNLTRTTQIEQLNQRLSLRTEQLLASMPNIGAGYYHKQLDAIVVYAPNNKHNINVGKSISETHKGRQVMATGESLIETGKQVRGDIMNAMIPIKRHNEIIGYIWANELLDDIEKQTMVLDKNIIITSLIGMFCSIILTSLLSRKLHADIDAVKNGLQALSFNLNTSIPPIKGELNEIVNGINSLSYALKETKSINDLILENSVDGVITVDNNGFITLLNPAAQKITGYTLDKIIGKPYYSIIDDKNFQSPLLDTLHNGNDHIGVEVDFPVSGKILRISVSTSHLRGAHGEILGAVVIFKDITEQKEVQRIMQQTERLAAIGELMAGVAHEIRNPLTAIRGFVQYLQNDPTPKEQEEFIKIILNEVDSINKVIQQLLDFSKPSKNYYVVTSVNQIIQDTLVLVKTSNHLSNITFHLDLDNNLPSIYLDKELIRQALLNLLINALQAINGKGFIEITSKWSDNHHFQVIEIRDSGTGFAQDITEKVFNPFFTTKPSGTGLGLAIVQKIVSSHNGRIQLSNHKNGGAIISISLPIA